MQADGEMGGGIGDGEVENYFGEEVVSRPEKQRGDQSDCQIWGWALREEEGGEWEWGGVRGGDKRRWSRSGPSGGFADWGKRCLSLAMAAADLGDKVDVAYARRWRPQHAGLDAA